MTNDRPPTTAEIYKPAPCDVARCREPTCRRQIVWVQYVKSGKKAPFDHPLTVVGEYEREGGGFILLVENRNHFITCTKPKQFNRPRFAPRQGSARR